MTQDETRSIFYKGIKVEHFDHNFFCEDGWKKRMKKDLIKVRKACKKLEKKHIEVNFSNVVDYLIELSRQKKKNQKNKSIVVLANTSQDIIEALS